MKNNIIDFGNLEKYIKEIEEIFVRDNLNIIEQNLILHQTLNRCTMKQKKQQMKDMTEEIPLGSLFRKITKFKGDE
jgi:hypothetical protein